MFLNNSEAGAADYQRWLGIGPINFRVVRNAFDTDLLPSAEAIDDCRKDYRSRLGIPDDGLVVGVVMRISDEKQPLLWLEIAARVRAALGNVHFLVVGDGPMRQTMEARALDILRGRVHFLGHQKQVMAAMAAMDLFLLTSRVEGLPNVLIEAQAIGVPVVTLDVGGAREAISAPLTGRLVGSSAPDLVADAVVASLQDQRWREMAARIGPLFVRERFGSERMILETMDAYGIATPQ
jgi:glycosyltransferase involved in cell wall biosynthesis